MTDENIQESMLYYVVINAEEQYSIWPENQAMPAGWLAQGDPDSKTACLAFIKTAWTDMRPLGLRKQMAADPLR
ncbi:Enterobactin biosynthesis protein YbdZ [Andreprevotia sp. IGB-42]|uniref:MbtH family protein n=1 Tax=Andreprevotia sp. IGB-42 TaxID=2497473 RepID=UPI00135B9FFD|nr:MbtH family NRPS accessory protein [Andreprevotia sp. IGB-42]KAF0811650.1 Enterobactin biosynthesis protein YbdZ [Andreprevotia sp. IGB-42]